MGGDFDPLGEIKSGVTKNRTITAGDGLTGGGDLSSDITLSVGAGTGISVGTDSIAVDLSVFDTDDLSEGVGNLYFTDERVDDRVAALLTAGANITLTYNDTTGTLEIASSGSADADTLDGQDGTYYLARANHTGTQASSTISDFSEAVDDRVASLIQAGTGISWTYNDASGTLTPAVSLFPFSTTDLSEGTNLYYTQARFDTAFSAKSTSDLSEGTNLYHTSERVDDRVAALLTEGDNVTLTYNDTSGTLTVAVPSSGFDADTLDGQHGAFYRDAANLNAGILPAARFNDTAHGNRGGGSLHAVATTGAHGFMSSTDKSKLDGIESGATGDQTAADIRALGFFDITNDGATSGLDADLLDGQHGSHFLARANHTGTQALSTITGHDKAAHDALNIDADTLDGLDSVSFLRSDIADTASGLIDFDGGITVRSGEGGGKFRIRRTPSSIDGDDIVDIYLNDSGLLFDVDNDNDGDSGNFSFRYKTAGTFSNLLVFSPGSITYQGNTVWHAGNDGVNSTMDSDLLDGQHGTHYLARANHTGTQLSSTISDFNEAAQDAVGSVLSDSSTINFTYNDASNTITADVIAGTVDAGTLDGRNGTNYAWDTLGTLSAETLRDVHDTGLYTYNVNNASLGDSTPTAYWSVIAGGRGASGTMQIAASWTSGGNKLYYRSLRDTTDNWWAWKQIWHESSDGSGSGLDADLLDGQHGTHYLDRANHTGTQLASTISNFNESVDDRVSSLLVGTDGIILTYDDAANTLTFSVGDIQYDTLNADEAIFGTGTFEGLFAHSNTADRTWTFPDDSGNVLVGDSSKSVQRASTVPVTINGLSSQTITVIWPEAWPNTNYKFWGSIIYNSADSGAGLQIRAWSNKTATSVDATVNNDNATSRSVYVNVMGWKD